MCWRRATDTQPLNKRDIMCCMGLCSAPPCHSHRTSLLVVLTRRAQDMAHATAIIHPRSPVIDKDMFWPHVICSPSWHNCRRSSQVKQN